LNAEAHSIDITLKPADNERLAALCGQLDAHLHQLEQRLGVEINSRGNQFRIIGEAGVVKRAGQILESLYLETESGSLSPEKVHLLLQEAGAAPVTVECGAGKSDMIVIKTPGGAITPRGEHQKQYLGNIMRHDLKAVACAVQALEQESVSRLVLVRPAVEAGERLYDALYEMLGIDRVAKLIERNVIEIAPLAFMRGRSLNDAFIILDEAQNTTVEQMKMFLTRIGFGSTAVVTGDITQIDLPKHTESGLRQVIEVLNNGQDIGFTFFSSSDVVRHPLVQRIISAYEKYEQSKSKNE